MDYRIDHMLDTGGRALSEADRQFVTLLFRELEQFQYQAPKDRALMFHPLRGYERYLIHKVTEIFPKLTSFSIGDEKNRRTVVCFKSKRKEQQLQLAQASPERRPPSTLRSSAKEPKMLRPSLKSKTLDSPARGRRRLSDPMGGKPKPGKYSTMDDNALKKRERGLTLEGPVVNGDRDFPRSDIEMGRRDSQGPRKKHRAKRSHSQPHLNNRNRSKNRRDSDSPDNQYSDLDGFTRKSRQPYSEANTPEKRRSKPYEEEPSPPRHLENEIARRRIEDIHTSSASDLSGKDINLEHSDVDNNEIPPSYDKMSESKVKSKAKRNMRRIKRTNSTRSCPPMNNPKNDYVNVNGGPMSRKEAEKLENSYQDSPVFPRRGKSNLSDAESRNSDARPRSKTGDKKGSSRRKSRDDRAPSRDYVNAPTEEVLHPNSYDTSPFESFSHDATDPIPNDIKETVIVANAPSESVLDPSSPRRVSSINNMESLPNHIYKGPENLVPLGTEIPLSSAEVMAASTPEKFSKEAQTDLHGGLVDAMFSTYNAHLDAFGQLAPLNFTAQPGSTMPPSSLRTSGTSTPSLSSPASTYEKLGEYMYKAMMNFQQMMIGQPTNGPTAYPAHPAAMYAPVAPTAQPMYVPWMAPYFADPNGPRPANIPYSTQSSTTGETCCHGHHHTHRPNSPLNKTTPRSSAHSSLKDVRKDARRSTPPSDHWHGHGHRYRDNDRTPSSAEHSMSAHPSRSSKVADGFESDVSSEITNPEVTVAEGGDGVMVYVRNRSTSSTGGASIGGSANSLQGPGGDNLSRASPLGHDNDIVFKKPPNSTASEDSKRSTRSKDKRTSPKGSPKKHRKSSKSKKSDEKPPATEDLDFVNGPGIANEEVILSIGSAPLATMEDEDDEFEGSASFASSHSDHHDANSESRAELLVGEDLSPLVCFDDNLEIACQDGSAED